MRPARGLTLVELMITVAVVAVLATLAAPSLYDFILMQRLRSINAQLVTDLQFARSEAVSRFERRSDDPNQNVDVQVAFRPAANGATMSCYTLYIDNSANPRNKCDCTRAPGLRCPAASTQEIRTVQLPVSQQVRLALPAWQARGFSFISATGGIRVWPVDVTVPSADFTVEASIDEHRSLRTTIGLSGRPTVCSPGGGVGGHAAC